MIIDRVVKAIEHQQLIAVGFVESLVTHAFLNVGRRRSKFVFSVGLDITFLVKPVNSVHSLGVHQIGRIPAPGSIENHIEGALIRVGFF